MNRLFILLILILLTSRWGYCQDSLKLIDLLEISEKNYPVLIAKSAQSKAAQEEIKVQKNTIVPSLDASYQTNYATYNNITGMSYPEYLLPISGPPSPGNSYSGVFGSAASLLLNWNPITFGQRTAHINIASQNYQVALSDESNAIYQQKLKVIAAYLDFVMADALIKVYEENIKRVDAQLRQIRSTSHSGIRPGVDTSLFQSELSKAKVELIHFRRYKRQLEINIGELIASQGISIAVDTTFLTRFPSIISSDSMIVHPLIKYNQNVLQLQEAYKTSIRKTLNPTLKVWGTTYARGSGIRYDGSVNNLSGLSFSRYNYAMGLQLSVPVLKFREVHLQLKKQDYQMMSYKAKLEETKLQLEKDSLNAQLAFHEAMEVAKEMPFQYEASYRSYRSLLSRYNAGLASFADLLQAQYSYVKAEADIKQSYMDTWKALLFQSAVSGDFNIFLNQLK